MPGNLDVLLKQHDDHITAILDAFTAHLEVILSRATASTIAKLSSRLSLTKGEIDRTRANQKILRSLDSLFIEEMDAAGFGSLVNAFIDQFPGQITFFYDIFEQLSSAMKNPLPAVQFSTADTKYFASQGINAADMIRDAVVATAATAKQQALFNVAGVKIGDLAKSLAEKFEISLPRAKSLADTAISTFYRTVADRGYQIAEKGLPANSILYSYLGPLDKITRPFCRPLETEARTGKMWDREQVDAMDNGQLPNVFLTGGGWNCRHQWGIAGLKEA